MSTKRRNNNNDNIEGYIPYVLGGTILGAIALNYLGGSKFSFATGTTSSGGQHEESGGGGNEGDGGHATQHHHSSSPQHHHSSSPHHQQHSHPATTTSRHQSHPAVTHHRSPGQGRLITPENANIPTHPHISSVTSPHHQQSITHPVHRVTHGSPPAISTDEGFGFHNAEGFGHGGGGRGGGGDMMGGGGDFHGGDGQHGFGDMGGQGMHGFGDMGGQGMHGFGGPGDGQHFGRNSDNTGNSLRGPGMMGSDGGHHGNNRHGGRHNNRGDDQGQQQGGIGGRHHDNHNQGDNEGIESRHGSIGKNHSTLKTPGTVGINDQDTQGKSNKYSKEEKQNNKLRYSSFVKKDTTVNDPTVHNNRLYKGTGNFIDGDGFAINAQDAWQIGNSGTRPSYRYGCESGCNVPFTNYEFTTGVNVGPKFSEGTAKGSTPRMTMEFGGGLQDRKSDSPDFNIGFDHTGKPFFNLEYKHPASGGSFSKNIDFTGNTLKTKDNPDGGIGDLDGRHLGMKGVIWHDKDGNTHLKTFVNPDGKGWKQFYSGDGSTEPILNKITNNPFSGNNNQIQEAKIRIDGYTGTTFDSANTQINELQLDSNGNPLSSSSSPSSTSTQGGTGNVIGSSTPRHPTSPLSSPALQQQHPSIAPQQQDHIFSLGPNLTRMMNNTTGGSPTSSTIAPTPPMQTSSSTPFVFPSQPDVPTPQTAPQPPQDISSSLIIPTNTHHLARSRLLPQSLPYTPQEQQQADYLNQFDTGSGVRYNYDVQQQEPPPPISQQQRHTQERHNRRRRRHNNNSDVLPQQDFLNFIDEHNQSLSESNFSPTVSLSDDGFFDNDPMMQKLMNGGFDQLFNMAGQPAGFGSGFMGGGMMGNMMGGGMGGPGGGGGGMMGGKGSKGFFTQTFVETRDHGHVEKYPAGWYTVPGPHHHCKAGDKLPNGKRCCCINHAHCPFGHCTDGGTTGKGVINNTFGVSSVPGNEGHTMHIKSPSTKSVVADPGASTSPSSTPTADHSTNLITAGLVIGLPLVILLALL